MQNLMRNFSAAFRMSFDPLSGQNLMQTLGPVLRMRFGPRALDPLTQQPCAGATANYRRRTARSTARIPSSSCPISEQKTTNRPGRRSRTTSEPVACGSISGSEPRRWP